MSQSLSLARSGSPPGPRLPLPFRGGSAHFCDRPRVARGRRRRAKIRQEFGRRRGPLAAQASITGAARATGERDQGRGGGPFKTPARGLGTCPVLALRPRTLIMRKTRLRVMRLNPVLRREVGREQDEVSTTALTG